MILFIVSETMFFFAFFWAYFHSALSRTVEIGLDWPPVGVNILDPLGVRLLNTCILLSSGLTITFAHHSYQSGSLNSAVEGLAITIILALVFTALQGLEYCTAGFTLSDSSYGSTFFMATGFHGFHVVIGTTILTVQLLRSYQYNFSSSRLYGFEGGS
jgi:cytochrome c oxidase subunit 3